MGPVSSTTPHAVMVCSPGMGHLIPFLELAKRLSSAPFSLKTTILFVTTQQPSSSRTPTPGVDLVEIPAADISRVVDPGAQVVTKIFAFMRHTLPAVRAAFAALAPAPTLLIVDMFASEYLSLVADLRLPKFVFITSSAWFLALTLHCPTLDGEVEGEYVDQAEPLPVPGCRPVKPLDVVEPMQTRTDQQYTEYMRMATEIPLFDGVLVNTWQGLEDPTLAALLVTLPIPVHDIGPLTRTDDPFQGVEDKSTNGSIDPPPLYNKGKDAIVAWLDLQPAKSVLYVSFGSGGTLSTAQMAEVAWGLELSGQRFVWVVRPPKDGEASASYFGIKGSREDEMGKYLPAGFVERTREVGLLVPLWAPQTEILAHRSTGGFLTHCGWNSAMESVVNGVPMIVWPMFGEQRMNATMLAEELEVAVRAREAPGKEVVGREEIEEMARAVMEGEEGRGLRRRVEGLQRSAARALGVGGSSNGCLSEFVKMCVV